MRQRLILILALSLLAPACRQREREHTPGLPPGKMARVYVQLTKLGVRFSAGRNDSLLRSSRVDSVLSGLGVTRQEVVASIDWYNAHLDRWNEVMDSATTLLEREQAMRR